MRRVFLFHFVVSMFFLPGLAIAQMDLNNMFKSMGDAVQQMQKNIEGQSNSEKSVPRNRASDSARKAREERRRKAARERARRETEKRKRIERARAERKKREKERRIRAAQRQEELKKQKAAEKEKADEDAKASIKAFVAAFKVKASLKKVLDQAEMETIKAEEIVKKALKSEFVK
ncbi:MAG: hypothetical protein CMM44_10775 [Rhodospirillaceae bacterium]|nr:hypothetical protein [Rhodospirillaceae bacterium]